MMAARIARDSTHTEAKAMQTKTEIRPTLLAARNGIPADQRSRLDNAIAAKILDWWNEKELHTIGVYWPMRGEPELHALYTTLHDHNVQLALPVVVGDDAPLKFVAWTPGEAMTADRFGASVPTASNQVLEPQALIIPCLGFNHERFRLGYGGGFYDRTLVQAPRPYTVGVAYAICETLFEVESYDIVLDMVITDQAIFAAHHHD
jgi:5-formyltetrahydrofolate cyclo-ligase